jgi:formylglycine-generating enzyme required for sulfatase activity
VFFWIAAACLAGPQEEQVRIPGTDVRFDMVLVPGGRMKLGATGREVDVKPFWIGKHEVTWGEFNPFYEFPEKEGADGVTRPSRGRDFLGLSGIPQGFLDPGRPVTNVRFHSALAWCRWLSVATGQYFRLPTEAEWEHACGPPPGPLEDHAWIASNSGGATHEGGKRKPNARGLCDMAGNVREYALEPFDPPGFGPVLRGGAWNSPAAEAGATVRKPVPAEWSEPDPSRPLSVWWFRGDFTQGFRAVRVPEPAGPEERKAYARSIAFGAFAGKERIDRVGGSGVSFTRVTGEVRNGGDRTLEELEIMIYFLTPDGKPHVKDVADYWAGYATFNLCYPVLANSAHAGEHLRPLGPGESRKFAVDLPTTLDGEDHVAAEKFGAAVTNLKFAPK